MGLSASQARLLTITARKSDCEYESMRLSHQKLALSRDMNNLSNEYQYALEQTKLMYDFYGNGSESQPLTYGLLMSPSGLNDYIPTLISDTSNRVVLNSKLAAAARAAGIPQEGLNGLPSSDLRNNFIDGLANQGVITKEKADSIKAVSYNQTVGLGNTDVVNIATAACSYNELVDMLADVKFDLSDLVGNTGGSDLDIYVDGNHKEDSDGYVKDISLKELLGNDENNNPISVRLAGLCWDNEDLRGNNGLYDFSVIDKVASATLWDQIAESFAQLLDTGDGYSTAALNYAYQKVMAKIECLCTPEKKDWSNAAYHDNNSKRSQGKVLGWVNGRVDGEIGYDIESNSGSDYNDAYGLNLTNMTKAYLTYFCQYMEGIGSSQFNVTNLLETSTLVGDPGTDFTFTYVAAVDTSGDNLMYAGFYDAIFNQICINGWTENDNVNDKDYLREMLQNGAMYINKVSDDGYYYQGNYSTDNYIKEVADEQYIAQAEAKYTREKEKLSYKENIIDMKMKNLDTEISALTTEYDTVKSVINKNIEKSFKRYSA